MARVESCQQALVKGQSKKRWVVDSSFSLHRGHVLEVEMPLFFRISG